MADLFKKLNVLVKASLSDLVGDSGAPRARRLPPERLGRDIDREIAALRGRINEAVEFEDGLRRRVAELQAEVERWDAEADAGVARGDDASARYAVEQMRRAEQRLHMAENDLRDHQLVTQELIQRVNTLEAVVADARRAAASSNPPPEEQAPADPLAGRSLSDVLRDAREKVASMGDLIAARDEVASAAPPTPTPPSGAPSIDDDLARRRQRLSK